MAAALAGLTLVMEPPAKDAAQSNTAMQAGPIPTPEEIADYTTKLTKIMNVDIPSYNKGRGRYKAADTARVSEISKVSLPDLRFGKTPSPQVWAHLTLGNYKELDGNDKRKKAIEAWQKREWPDAKAERSTAEDAQRQRTILSTAATTKQDMEHRGGQNLEGACCCTVRPHSRCNVNYFMHSYRSGASFIARVV